MARTNPPEDIHKKLTVPDLCVKDLYGATHHVRPVKALKGNIDRFLPPPGQYYDQSTLEGPAQVSACVLCWHPKASEGTCKCWEKCVLCDTKQHRGTDCSKFYASISWWQEHGHRVRKRAQIRPTPQERAYLVVVGVFKDWKRLEDPVVVNMSNHVVKAFYAGKDTPQSLTDLPMQLRSALIASTVQPSEVPPSFGSIANQAEPFQKYGFVDPASSSAPVQCGELALLRHFTANAGTCDTANDNEDGRPTRTKSAPENGSFQYDLLKDTWQPLSYHEGIRIATVTPLSIRLAIYTAQQFMTATQPDSSKSSEIHPELDPRLQARAARLNSIRDHQSPSALNTSRDMGDGSNQGRVREDKCGTCHEELKKAREEIKAKDRRIHELELALHETDGWADTSTYQGGQKRRRV